MATHETILAFRELYDNDNGQLSILQILHIIWTIICIIANIVMIFVVQRRNSKENGFYFVMTSWCFANILFMSVWLYFGVVPESYMKFYQSTIFYVTGAIILTIPCTHVPLILTDFLLKPTETCRNVVYSVWGATIVTIGCLTVAMKYYFITPHVIVTIGLVQLFIIFLFCQALFYIKYSKVENTILRISLSCVCIFSNIVHWALQWLYYFNDFDRFDLDVSIAFLYGSSIINLVLFMCLDQETNVCLHESLKNYETKSLLILGLTQKQQDTFNIDQKDIQIKIVT